MAPRKGPIRGEHTETPSERTRGAGGRFARRAPGEREEDRVKEWQSQLRAADKCHDEWERRFEVKRGEEYFEGKQWGALTDDQARDLYVVNLTLAAVETQKPSLLFQKPQIRMESRPSRKDQLQAAVLEKEAKLSQQAVQTFIDDPDVKFMLNTALAIQDAHFRFGIVEVGYTADFIDNPHAGKPLLPTKPDEAGKLPPADETTNTDVVDAAAAVPQPGGVAQPPTVVKPGTEDLFVKWIPADQFRTSLSEKNDLTANDWVAYFEWMRVSDLKANKKYKNTKDLKGTGTLDAKYRDGMATKDEVDAKHGMVKVWKIWDLRGKVKHVLAEGHQKHLLEGEPWKVFPFADLKFIERLRAYYPIPVVYNWLGPQDEVNEQREHGRTMRRRSRRRYAARVGAIDPVELEKLQNGPDGVTAWEKQDGAVRALQEGAVDSSVWRTGLQADQDFVNLTGITGEQRGVAEADSATQASILDARAKLRESAARVKVQNWLASIARLMLLHLREHMVLPFVIKTQLDPATATPEETLVTALLWSQITAKDLGSVDMDVTVDLASLSPVSQDAERVTWSQVLALLSNPTILFLFTQSETILRKTLGLYGISSEQEVREIQTLAQVMVEQQQMAASMAALTGGKGGGAAPLPPGPRTMAAGAGQTPGGSEMLAQVEQLQ